jgi:mannose-6-phosphate isomerase-like protein (cupin superfamily)
LRSGELAVVPKGVEHRSHSTARASVVLLSGGFMSERKNGRHRLYAIPGEAQLSPVNLERAVERHATHFRFRTVARLEEAVVQTAQGTGTWPIQVPCSHSALYFVLKGSATVTTSQAFLHLHPGEFTVVPEGMLYRLSTTRNTALVRITHEDALE